MQEVLGVSVGKEGPKGFLRGSSSSPSPPEEGLVV